MAVVFSFTKVITNARPRVPAVATLLAIQALAAGTQLRMDLADMRTMLTLGTEVSGR
jgi:hypothetical protein